jgi:lysozyme
MMKTPIEAVLLILSYEQLRLRRYKDAVGKETIGWGHLCLPPPRDGWQEITREKANELFLVDLVTVERGVTRRLDEVYPGPGILVPELCYGALVSLAFNVGAAGLGSGLLAAVRDDIHAVPDWIRKYDKAGGRVLAGLTERRDAEARLWEAGVRSVPGVRSTFTGP